MDNDFSITIVRDMYCTMCNTHTSFSVVVLPYVTSMIDARDYLKKCITNYGWSIGGFTATWLCPDCTTKYNNDGSK